ncbi:hypothetical protein ASF06_09070 [Agreia sp. Leaf244]|nr:hypothetical protein ASF06_09070 [Agreia sp. Leaf244]
MRNRSRRWLLTLAITSFAICVAGIVVLALRAILPGLIRDSGDFLTSFSDPSSWWGIAVILGAAAALWFAVVRIRVTRKKRSSVLPLLALGGTTIVLGLSAYIPCTGGQAPFWAPLTWTIALFVGSAENPFGDMSGCAAEMPLALQLARLTALLVLSLGVAGVIGVLFRDRLDRRRTHRARSVVVVVGVDESSLAILRRVRAETPRRTVVAALIDENAPEAVRDSARAVGCTVLSMETENAQLLVPLVRAGRSGASGLVALYCLRPDAASNLQTWRAFRDAHEKLKSPGGPPRAVIRLDDPWQSEYWRRKAISTPDGWILDTTSVFENTARVVVRGILDRGIDRVAVVGTTPLALAILAEFAQRRRELDASRFDTSDVIPHVMAVGPDADTVVEEHRLRQRRFGNRHTSFSPEAVLDPADWRSLGARLQSASHPAVVIADPEFGRRFASSLAARSPDWVIFAFDPAAHGLPLEAVMEQLYDFGPIIDPADGATIDSWERVARIAHANYLHDLGHPSGGPTKPSAQPWEALSPFYRESNVRLIMTTLSSAGAVGRTWAADALNTSATPAADLSADQVSTMARLEHESWRAHHLDNGWRSGTVRDDADRIHPWLIPWEELPAEAIERSERTVLDAMALLATLGYHSVPSTEAAPTAPPVNSTWTPARRMGTVTARKVDDTFSWRNQNGDTLTSSAGDWRVEDETGAVWSVDASEFAGLYEQVDENTWQRTGVVSVRPGIPGEIVHTWEGPATVTEGDWVVRGRAGEVWNVSASHFAERYELIDEQGSR